MTCAYIYVFSSTGKQETKVDAVATPVIYPTDYGADPFGKSDSFPAFAACLKVFINNNLIINQ